MQEYIGPKVVHTHWVLFFFLFFIGIVSYYGNNIPIYNFDNLYSTRITLYQSILECYNTLTSLPTLAFHYRDQISKELEMQATVRVLNIR